MKIFRVQTMRDSTYLVGRSPNGARVRVARISTHPLSGTDGPVAFADDFDVVDFVPHPEGLRLRCRQIGGSGFTTSPIVAVTDEEFDGELPASMGEIDVAS